MSEICPKKTIRAIPPKAGPGTIDISTHNNRFRVNEIEYKTDKAVLFRLLLCREEKIMRDPLKHPDVDNCSFPEHYNPYVDIVTGQYACRNPKDNIAHIYYRHETLQNGEQSCIVAFVKKLEGAVDIIAQQFINTVNWLKIINEKPYYRLIYILNAHIDLNSRYIKREIQTIIRNALPSLTQEICEIVELEKGHKKLVIDFDDNQFIIEPA